MKLSFALLAGAALLLFASGAKATSAIATATTKGVGISAGQILNLGAQKIKIISVNGTGPSDVKFQYVGAPAPWGNDIQSTSIDTILGANPSLVFKTNTSVNLVGDLNGSGSASIPATAFPLPGVSSQYVPNYAALVAQTSAMSQSSSDLFARQASIGNYYIGTSSSGGPVFQGLVTNPK